jgi:tetratricopeptide (TPR) repeat protein
MNQRLRTLLLILGAATLVAIGVYLYPYVAGLYYQIKGSQALQATFRSIDDTWDLEVTCEPVSESKQGVREKLQLVVARLEKSNQYNPRISKAHIDLGQAYCLLGEPEKALVHYQKYTELRPKNPLGMLGMGFAYEALGDQVAASKAWTSAGYSFYEFYEAGNEATQIKKYDSAIRWYERALLVDPRQAKPWLGLAKVYDALGDPDLALSAYEHAWTRDQELSALDYASALKRYGDDKSLEPIFREVLAQYPKSSQRLAWWKALGDFLASEKEYEKAEIVYKEASLEFPKAIDVLISLGWLYFERGDGSQAALDQFNRAVAIDDQIGNGYFAIAQLYSRIGKYTEADSNFQQAIDRSLNNRWYYLSKADNQRQQGDINGAIEAYNNIILKFPDFAHAYYQLAYSYKLVDKLPEAINAIEQAIKLGNPPADSYYARAGEIYRAAEMTEKAMSAYRNALAINPSNLVAKKGLESLESK